MIITKRAISRRTLLRGMGVSLALPLLDGMIPAFAGVGAAVTTRPRRLSVIYVPNGMMMPSWTPATEGAGFAFPRTVKSLEPLRDYVTLVSGLKGVKGNGAHAGAATRFMTDVNNKLAENSEIEAGISMDQYAAMVLGKDTQLSSLELAIEGRDFAGSCDVGLSCAYTNTISWRSPTTPLPMDNDPRSVFERLFGDSGTTDGDARAAQRRSDRSILDSITEKATGLSRRLGGHDRGKLDQYLDAVRDVERRIQTAESQSTRELPIVEQPAAAPSKYRDHARLMFDLQVLAMQADLTRVITFMLGREISGLTYPDIDVFDAHHPTSHHQNDPAKIESVTKINGFHMSLAAEFAEKLRATPDGDGSLLDHSLIYYGPGMADSDAHSPDGVPVTLIGGCGGQVKGGRHLRFAPTTPLANLHLTLLDKLGAPVDRIGNSDAMVSL
jgi:uncharacterized protein DUF1552